MKDIKKAKKTRKLLTRNGTKYLPIYQNEVEHFGLNNIVEVKYVKSKKRLIITAVSNERIG